MRKLISSLLIIVGIIFIIVPMANDLLIKKNSQSQVKTLEKISYEEIEKNQDVEAVYDYDSIEDVSVASTIFGALNFESKYLLGQLTIPDLDIDLPVLKGINNSNLAVGAATMVADQEMGRGNYSLAGHKMKKRDLLFGALMDIEVDSMVYLTDKNKVYEYKIYDTRVVEDTAFYMLEDLEAEERGRPIISLMTCYYSSKTGKRFFALGELVDEYPYEDSLSE